jgi:hypothetical protein
VTHYQASWVIFLLVLIFLFRGRIKVNEIIDHLKTENKKLPFWDVVKTFFIFVFAFAVVFFVAEKISSLFVQKPQQSQSSQTSQATATLGNNAGSRRAGGWVVPQRHCCCTYTIPT